MTRPTDEPHVVTLPGRIFAGVSSVLLVALLAGLWAAADYDDERERWQRLFAVGIGLMVVTGLTLVPNNRNLRGPVRGALVGIHQGVWTIIGLGLIVRLTTAPWDEPGLREVVFFGVILGAFLGAAVGWIRGRNEQKRESKKRRQPRRSP